MIGEVVVNIWGKSIDRLTPEESSRHKMLDFHHHDRLESPGSGALVQLWSRSLIREGLWGTEIMFVRKEITVAISRTTLHKRAPPGGGIEFLIRGRSVVDVETEIWGIWTIV